MKRRTTLCSLFLVSFLVPGTAGEPAPAPGAAAAGPSKPAADPAPRPLPADFEGDILKFTVNGASGVVFHPGRKTLFVVSDWMEFFELDLAGRLLRRGRTSRFHDLEGITVNPATGMLYLVTERTDSIVEVDPETLRQRREFPVERTFRGRLVLSPAGEGLEGIAFRPDPKHPEGGTFFVSNQAGLGREDDLSAVFEVEAPLKSGGKRGGKARILRYFSLGVEDLSGLYYDTARKRLYVLSGLRRLLLEVSLEGKVLRTYRMPRPVTIAQEGVAFDAEGRLYIAIDGGGLLRFRWRGGRPTSRPRTQPAATRPSHNGTAGEGMPRDAHPR